MQIAPFALERWFARHEFTARHLLSSSDCEALSAGELVAMADPALRRTWEELRLGYTESAGHPQLREGIAAMYRRVEPEDVLTVVPVEGIFLVMHAVLQPGDHVVCVAPAYQALHEVARSIGCEVSSWRPVEAYSWRFEVKDLEAALRDETRLVVVNFPHNPTGAVATATEMAEIVRVVERCGARLLSDEMYRLLELAPGATAPSACDLSETAITLSGLSKAFGLPGLRVGWLACRDRELLRRVALLKDYTTICGSAPSEVLAIMALASSEAIVGRQVARVRRNLDHLAQFMARHEDRFRWHPPAGGSVCFPRSLGPDPTDELAERAVAEAGVLLVPSTMFGFGDRHLRFGCGREDFPQALARFERFLDSLG